MRRLLSALLAATLLAPAYASAQSFAIAGHAGTMGIGGSVIVGVMPNLNARGSFGLIPTEPDFTVDDVDFTVDFPSLVKVTADYYPTGFFYLSGGGLFVLSSGDINVEGQFNGSQEFGGNTYTGAEVGTLTGVFSLSSAMPYLGIGFGNPIGKRVGFMLDLGVGFGSVPTVELGATGPIASDPTFQSDLNQREAEFQDDIPELLKYYPIASLSVSIGLGG
ncbi:MAG: hypothetical protein PVJ80_01335 [Gemmatimonadota bacterium]|jgi:hypothetical protein